MTFEALMTKVSPTLKRITYKLDGHCASCDDNDLFQEALLRLWLDFNAGKLGDKTDSYILQGCYFHLKNYIRTYRDKAKVTSLEVIRRNHEEESGPQETFDIKDEKSTRFFDELNDKLLAETIHNNGFTYKEKQILRFYAEGLTTREIGARCGVSHVSVVKAMARIREKSRKYLE